MWIETAEDLFHGILKGSFEASQGSVIGRSRGERPILGFHLGTGPFRISLLAGCHADEPVGPRLLRLLAGYLGSLPRESPLLHGFEWWIVPHANPDGREANRRWIRSRDEAFRLGLFLAHGKREGPGDDIEFGFPRHPADREARPENLAISRWWRESEQPFDLHVSLHGMAFAAGPWFLIEPEWASRCRDLKKRCRQAVFRLGYRLHDVDRQGEKGFFRLEEGFCTHPSCEAMARYFRELKDPETAGLFRPSSMEAARALGGDPLTLVTEMPLFLLPGVGREILPRDEEADRWRERIASWRAELARRPGEVSRIDDEARRLGVRPMPIRDQMELQWVMIASGIEQVLLSKGG